LQLAVYAEAVQREMPDADVEARYWFTRENEGGEGTARSIAYDNATRRRFADVLTTMVDGIGSGTFPPVAGEDVLGKPQNCRHCPYDRICPADRAELWERKGDGPAVRAYVDLTNVDPTNDETGS
jgi:hypothetical protein